MKTLFEPLTNRGKTLSNRICVPPMVCFNWADDSGTVSVKHVEHYRAVAVGGPGLIIQEATCVTKEGRLSPTQLGIWSDDHVEGLRTITDAAHSQGCPIYIQLHHAGVVGINPQPLCPDAYTLPSGVVGKKMDDGDIEKVCSAFIQAGRRAYEAGYDGVELHGCHRYLLCQFLNSTVNRRDDVYGQHPERLVLEIVDGIRALVPDSFAVGIRLGAFEPSLEDGLRHAKILEEGGIDFLNISYGFQGLQVPLEQPVELPEGFPFKDVVFAAGEFKKHCSVPVFAVNGIRTPADAQEVLEWTDVDMVDIGRSILADYAWPAKAKKGLTPGRCLDCKQCLVRTEVSNCIGRKALGKAQA